MSAGLPPPFVARGAADVRPPFLGPEATGRFLCAQLTTLRADARARGEPVCVTFQEDSVDVTELSGRRRTWLLPEGLRLAGGPVHVVMGADLSVVVHRGGAAQTATEEAVTVVVARMEEPGGRVEKSRLLAKGGLGFQTISTSGAD